MALSSTTSLTAPTAKGDLRRAEYLRSDSELSEPQSSPAAEVSGGSYSLSSAAELPNFESISYFNTKKYDSSSVMINWLASFGSSYFFWSGDHDFSFEGNLYRSASFIQLSASEYSVGAPSTRLQASFSAADSTIRAALLQDPGPLVVEIQYLVSTDSGLSWRALSNKFVGRLSNPVIRYGIYSVEIETIKGDVDRGDPQKWSDEDQQARFSGDRGLEFVRQISAGVETRFQ